MSGLSCHNCGKPLHETATFDEREELYFCDSECWRAWADFRWDKIVEYYRSMNVVDDETVGGET